MMRDDDETIKKIKCNLRKTKVKGFQKRAFNMF